MNKIKNTVILICFLVLSGLSGCGRDEEILYFDSVSSDGTGTQDTGRQTDGQAQPVSGGAEISQDAAGQIYVHVCGQVCRPGVVELPAGSRAWEAVEAAGGLTEDAQDTAVNLAAVVQDGEKLYIPHMGEAVADTVGEAADSGLINLNTADAGRLQTLPGIGESRAADILSYRERYGGFQSIEEIMQVPGIKESIYEKIKDKIMVD